MTRAVDFATNESVSLPDVSFNGYVLKQRKYAGLKQWMSPRNGWQSRKSWDGWKVVSRFNYLKEARKALRESSKSGLDRWGLFYQGKLIEEG